jgi:hypothetical protein
MIVALLLAVAAPAPVLHYAEARSIAYRTCIVAEHRKRPASTVAQIGRERCSGARAKLFDSAHSHVRYGWRAVRMNARQAQRLKAQHKVNAETEIVRYETALQAWLGATEAASAGR